jgi:hypothetical protein
MATAKMLNPSDLLASASYNGQSFSPNKKGIIVVPEEAIESLKSHGFILGDQAEQMLEDTYAQINTAADPELAKALQAKADKLEAAIDALA